MDKEKIIIAQEKFNLAAIDIGSNGARLLIKEFSPTEEGSEPCIKKVLFIRVPLRLGKDVSPWGRFPKSASI